MSEVFARRALAMADARGARLGRIYACPLCDRPIWPIEGRYLAHVDSAHPEAAGSLA